MSNYPQHDKMKKLRDLGHIALAQELLEFLEGGGVQLAAYNKRGGGDGVAGGKYFDRDYVEHLSKEKLLYRFFDIDEKAFHKEKDAMLEELRNMNKNIQEKIKEEIK